MTKPGLLLTCAMALGLLGLAEAARADDPDEITTTGRVAPLLWDPIIALFEAQPQPQGPTVTPRILVSKGVGNRAPLQEVRDWESFKPKIRPPRSASGWPLPYLPNDTVYSGWRRIVGSDGRPVFETIGPFRARGVAILDQATLAVSPHEYRVQAVSLKEGQLRLEVQLDVLMSASQDFTQKVLQDHFKLLQLTIIAQKVGDSPLDFRNPVRWNEPARKPVLQIGAKDATDGQAFNAVASVASGPLEAKWPLTETGVFQFHVWARVQGKVFEDEEPQTRWVEGAMRIAVVDGDVNQVPVTQPANASGAQKGKP